MLVVQRGISYNRFGMTANALRAQDRIAPGIKTSTSMRTPLPAKAGNAVGDLAERASPVWDLDTCSSCTAAEDGPSESESENLVGFFNCTFTCCAAADSVKCPAYSVDRLRTGVGVLVVPIRRRSHGSPRGAPRRHSISPQRIHAHIYPGAYLARCDRLTGSGWALSSSGGPRRIVRAGVPNLGES